MQTIILRLVCLLIILLPVGRLRADSLEKKLLTISGYVRDASNGEVLIGATVFIQGKSTGTATNAYGFYSLSIEPGDYQVRYGFIGFKTEVREVKLTGNTTINIDLASESQQLGELEVVANKQGVDLRKPEMGDDGRGRPHQGHPVIAGGPVNQ